jgi:hypothetical protein
MIKRVLLSVFCMLMAAGFIAGIVSAEGGNARKGKHLFRTTCRQCHQEGAAATPLSPDSKTQAQWEKTFKPETYQELACKDEWAKQSKEDLTDMFTYLHEHAYDSPSPAKCK